MNRDPSETKGYYYAQRQFDALEDIPNGDFTFQVTDHQGRTETFIDTLTPMPVGVPQNIKPAEGTTTGILPKFTWDACANAVRYMVRLYDGWNSTLFRSPKIEETEYTLPAEHQLDPGALSANSRWSRKGAG